MKLGLGLDVRKASAPAFKGLLDKFTGAVAAYSTRKLTASQPNILPADYGDGAAAAYSLRKVKASYSGNCIDVRRSSDDTTSSIGFSGNELDTTALEAFVNEDVVRLQTDFSGETPSPNPAQLNVSLTSSVSILGEDDVLEVTLSGGASSHYFYYGAGITAGQYYRISFDYYIPSGQTLDYVRVGVGVEPEFNTTGEWVRGVSFTQIATKSFCIFRFTSNAADNNKFYIKNIVVTQTTADGFVTKWYDQSGTNHAEQATDNDQPQIVDAGSTILENGKPAIQFDGVDDGLETSSYFANFLHESESSVFAVASVNSGTSNGSAIISTSNQQNYESANIAYYLAVDNRSPYTNRGGVFVTNGAGGYAVSNTTDSRYVDDQQYLISVISDPSNATPANRSLIYNDGANLLQGNSRSDTPATGDSDDFLKIYKTSSSLKGIAQEVIIFDSDQSDNRQDIEWNINNHYNIYTDSWDKQSAMEVRRAIDNETTNIGFVGKDLDTTALETFASESSPVLDDYTGAAAAYSLRKVRTAYTGDAVRVRRSSDDELQDIGFDANGDLDTTALLAFVNESGNAYTSDFTSTEDLFEANGTGAAAQSVGGVDDAYKFTLSGGSNSHFSGLANFIDTGANVSVSFDYYIPSTNSKVDTIGLYSCTPTLSETQIDQWASVSNFETTLNSDDFYFFARKGTDPVSTLDADGDVFYLKNIVVTQTTADGAVTTWYDQSGNGNDATQTTADNQPLVVSGGTLVEENSKAAVDFDGSAQVLQNSVGASDLSNVSMFVTAGISQTNDDATIVTYPDIGTNGGVSIGQGGVGTAAQIGLRYRISGVEIDTDGIALTTGQKLLSALCTASTTAELFENGTAGALNVSARLNFSNFEIGAAGNSAFHFDGTIQEVVIFESDQSTNRTGIEGNIGRYYNIDGFRDVFVAKWYDQSGNFNHAQNTTDTEQPQIVSSGSVETLGSKVTPVRQGVTTTLDVSGVESSVTGAFTIATRFYLSSQSDLDCIFGGRGLTAGAGLCASYLSGAWRFEVVTTTGTRAIVIVSDSNTPINNWYNVIFTWDGTTDSNAVKVYLNTSSNVFTATANGTVINYDASHPMSIFNANRNSFDGGLATWDIWNSQITDIDGLFSAMEH